jgi:uncharacterized repeat protein (TIGR02543 family)
VASGDKAAAPSPAPTKADHTLDGWYTEAAYTTKWDFAVDTVTADITLYAKWTPTYTVSFNAQDGTPTPAQQTVASGGKVAAPSPVPTKAGYTLDGWYTEAAYTTKWDFAVNTVTAAITLHAKWTAVQAGNFVVTFDSQGGTLVPAQTVTSGGKATAPTSPTKAEDDLVGWYKDAAGTTAWNFATDTVTAGITLYAKWTLKTYTVSFNAQGGTPTPTQQSVASGGKATAPSPGPTKDGVPLDGWYTEGAYTTIWDFAVNTVTAPTTLHAKWTLKTYTVSFNAQDGTPTPTQQTVASGGKVAAPSPVPTKDGFTLDGWYTEAAYTTKWDFAVNTVTAAITLHAKWTAVQAGNFVVTFDSQGGTLVSEQTVTSGGKATVPTAPIKAEYDLVGWYKDAAGTTEWNFATDTVTAAITLYAKWTLKNYTVTFNAHDGTPAPEPQTVPSSGKVTEPQAPTKAEHTLDGWYKEAAYTTKWDFAVDTVTAAITLYAKWTPIIYTVTFNVQGGTPAPTPQPVASGNKATEPSPAPTKAGHALDGWYKEETYATKWNFATDTVTAGITLYAKWRYTFVAVTGISGVPSKGIENLPVSLAGAAAQPEGATNRTIVWSVKTPGAGVSQITGNSFIPSDTGTVTLLATITGGKDIGVDYTQEFSITIYEPGASNPDIGLPTYGSIVVMNSSGNPLSLSEPIPVALNAVNYYVSVSADYTDIAWYLNGRKSEVTSSRIYLDTGTARTIKLTVEGKKGGKLESSGTYTFTITNN